MRAIGSATRIRAISNVRMRYLVDSLQLAEIQASFSLPYGLQVCLHREEGILEMAYLEQRVGLLENGLDHVVEQVFAAV